MASHQEDKHEEALRDVYESADRKLSDQRRSERKRKDRPPLFSPDDFSAKKKALALSSSSPSSSADSSIVKKHRIIRRRHPAFSSADRPYDVLPSGQPFSCDLCQSPYVCNPLLSKGGSRGKRSRHMPIPRQKLNAVTGKLLTLCNACAQSLDSPSPAKPVRQVSQEEKDAYTAEAKAFASKLANRLQDAEAERLYCPSYSKAPCGCLQNYLAADGNRMQMLERGKELLALYKQARQLSSEKAYSLDELGKKYACKKKAKYGTIGLGNGHKRSQRFEAFIIEHRKHLKSDRHLCERATQRILCYSNNFLHKKLKTDERGSRVVRQKGKAALGLLDPLELLGRRHCCIDQCVRMVYSHRNLLSQWRKQAMTSQSEARRVLAEMLTPSGGVRCNCYKFISWVTGCSLSTIGKVRDQMRRTKGDREPPQHGLYTYWERRTHSKKHKKRPSSTATPDNQGDGIVCEARSLSKVSSVPSDWPLASLFAGSTSTGRENSSQREQLLNLQDKLLQQQAFFSQQQQLVQQQIAAHNNVQQISWTLNASNLASIQQQVLQQMAELHTAQQNLANTIDTLQKQLATLQPAQQLAAQRPLPAAVTLQPPQHLAALSAQQLSTPIMSQQCPPQQQPVHLTGQVSSPHLLSSLHNAQQCVAAVTNVQQDNWTANSKLLLSGVAQDPQACQRLTFSENSQGYQQQGILAVRELLQGQRQQFNVQSLQQQVQVQVRPPFEVTEVSDELQLCSAAQPNTAQYSSSIKLQHNAGFQQKLLQPLPVVTQQWQPQQQQTVTMQQPAWPVMLTFVHTGLQQPQQQPQQQNKEQSLQSQMQQHIGQLQPTSQLQTVQGLHGLPLVQQITSQTADPLTQQPGHQELFRLPPYKVNQAPQQHVFPLFTELSHCQTESSSQILQNQEQNSLSAGKLGQIRLHNVEAPYLGEVFQPLPRSAELTQTIPHLTTVQFGQQSVLSSSAESLTVKAVGMTVPAKQVSTDMRKSYLECLPVASEVRQCQDSTVQLKVSQIVPVSLQLQVPSCRMDQSSRLEIQQKTLTCTQQQEQADHPCLLTGEGQHRTKDRNKKREVTLQQQLCLLSSKHSAALHHKLTAPAIVPNNTLTAPAIVPNNTLTAPAIVPNNTLTASASVYSNTLIPPASVPNNKLTASASVPNNTLTASASVYSNTLIPPASVPNNALTASASMPNNTLTASASVYSNTLIPPASVPNNALTASASMPNNTLTASASVPNNTLTASASVYNNTLIPPAAMPSNTLTASASVSNNILIPPAAMPNNTLTVPASVPNTLIATASVPNALTTPTTPQQGSHHVSSFQFPLVHSASGESLSASSNNCSHPVSSLARPVNSGSQTQTLCAQMAGEPVGAQPLIITLSQPLSHLPLPNQFVLTTSAPSMSTTTLPNQFVLTTSASSTSSTTTLLKDSLQLSQLLLPGGSVAPLVQMAKTDGPSVGQEGNSGAQSLGENSNVVSMGKVQDISSAASFPRPGDNTVASEQSQQKSCGQNTVQQDKKKTQNKQEPKSGLTYLLSKPRLMTDSPFIVPLGTASLGSGHITIPSKDSVTVVTSSAGPSQIDRPSKYGTPIAASFKCSQVSRPLMNSIDLRESGRVPSTANDSLVRPAKDRCACPGKLIPTPVSTDPQSATVFTLPVSVLGSHLVSTQSLHGQLVSSHQQLPCMTSSHVQIVPSFVQPVSGSAQPVPSFSVQSIPSSFQSIPSSFQPLPTSVQPVQSSIQPMSGSVRPVPSFSVQPIPSFFQPLPTSVQAVPVSVQPVPSSVQPVPSSVQAGVGGESPADFFTSEEGQVGKEKQGNVNIPSVAGLTSNPVAMTTTLNPGDTQQPLSVSAPSSLPTVQSQGLNVQLNTGGSQQHRNKDSSSTVSVVLAGGGGLAQHPKPHPKLKRKSEAASKQENQICRSAAEQVKFPVKATAGSGNTLSVPSSSAFVAMLPVSGDIPVSSKTFSKLATEIRSSSKDQPTVSIGQQNRGISNPAKRTFGEPLLIQAQDATRVRTGKSKQHTRTLGPQKSDTHLNNGSTSSLVFASTCLGSDNSHTENSEESHSAESVSKATLPPVSVVQSADCTLTVNQSHIATLTKACSQTKKLVLVNDKLFTTLAVPAPRQVIGETHKALPVGTLPMHVTNETVRQNTAKVVPSEKVPLRVIDDTGRACLVGKIPLQVVGETRGAVPAKIVPLQVIVPAEQQTSLGSIVVPVADLAEVSRTVSCPGTSHSARRPVTRPPSTTRCPVTLPPNTTRMEQLVTPSSISNLFSVSESAKLMHKQVDGNAGLVKMSPVSSLTRPLTSSPLKLVPTNVPVFDVSKPDRGSVPDKVTFAQSAALSPQTSVTSSLESTKNLSKQASSTSLQTASCDDVQFFPGISVNTLSVSSTSRNAQSTLLSMPSNTMSSQVMSHPQQVTPTGFPVSVTPVGERKQQMMCITSPMNLQQLQVLLSHLQLPVGSVIKQFSSPDTSSLFPSVKSSTDTSRNVVLSQQVVAADDSSSETRSGRSATSPNALLPRTLPMDRGRKKSPGNTGRREASVTQCKEASVTQCKVASVTQCKEASVTQCKVASVTQCKVARASAGRLLYSVVGVSGTTTSSSLLSQTIPSVAEFVSSQNSTNNGDCGITAHSGVGKATSPSLAAAVISKPVSVKVTSRVPAEGASPTRQKVSSTRKPLDKIRTSANTLSFNTSPKRPCTSHASKTGTSSEDSITNAGFLPVAVMQRSAVVRPAMFSQEAESKSYQKIFSSLQHDKTLTVLHSSAESGKSPTADSDVKSLGSKQGPFGPNQSTTVPGQSTTCPNQAITCPSHFITNTVQSSGGQQQMLGHTLSQSSSSCLPDQVGLRPSATSCDQQSTKSQPLSSSTVQVLTKPNKKRRLLKTGKPGSLKELLSHPPKLDKVTRPDSEGSLAGSELRQNSGHVPSGLQGTDQVAALGTTVPHTDINPANEFNSAVIRLSPDSDQSDSTFCPWKDANMVTLHTLSNVPHPMTVDATSITTCSNNNTFNHHSVFTTPTMDGIQSFSPAVLMSQADWEDASHSGAGLLPFMSVSSRSRNSSGASSIEPSLTADLAVWPFDLMQIVARVSEDSS